MKSNQNQELSKIFTEMSNIYKYLGTDERFRTLAYEKAAKVIRSLPADVIFLIKNNTLSEVNGIGESIAEKIEEYVKTGKIKKYEKLKKEVPFNLLEMLSISGFGPQSLKRIHNELKISTKEKIIEALQDGRIEQLKGFGKKKVENMLRGLKLHKTVETRMLLLNALETGEEILSLVKKIPEVKQAELAGSLRRKKETIGDIDLLVACEEKFRKKIMTQFTSLSVVKEVLAKGDTKASILLKNVNRQVDLRLVNENEWGAALQYFTGSKEHNVHLRTIAKEKGYKISEYGVFSLKDEKKIAGKTEKEIYDTIGIQLMPPEMREDRGEIELAIKNKIPQLLSLHDICGDMHMHSTYSDGINSIEEISKHIQKNFNYKYIVLTDHSKSSRVAGGMDEKEIIKQMKEIAEVNKKLKIDFVKAGIEVDILPDGKLDISDEILSQLDWVTASVHSNFNSNNTERIILACENKYVSCIGHPTGRLIGKREPYRIEIEKVLESAKYTNTALEINSQPDRMDLNDEYAMRARKMGVKLVISTDSHSLADFKFMKLGVFIARRAWCTADDILNTKSWKEIEKFRQKKISALKEYA